MIIKLREYSVDIVELFEDILDKPNIYKLFIFDEEKQRFDIITRKSVEDLTENFGFALLNKA